MRFVLVWYLFHILDTYCCKPYYSDLYFLCSFGVTLDQWRRNKEVQLCTLSRLLKAISDFFLVQLSIAVLFQQVQIFLSIRERKKCNIGVQYECLCFTLNPIRTSLFFSEWFQYRLPACCSHFEVSMILLKNVKVRQARKRGPLWL